MADIIFYVKELNIPIKNQKLSDQIKEQEPQYIMLTTHQNKVKFQYKDANRCRIEVGKCGKRYTRLTLI